MKKPDHIKKIEAKPREERTLEEYEYLNIWQFHNPSTPEEKEAIAEINRMGFEMQERIDETLKFLGVENATSEEQNRALLLHLKQKEEDVKEIERKLKEKEESLKEIEAKLEAEKKELKEEQKGSYRKPKHLVNAMTQLRPVTSKDINLFSGLDETKVAKFKTPLMIGLELSRGERKLVNCFSMMLHQRSQTIDTDKDNYFAGETNNPTFQRYSNDDIIAPKPELRFTLYELSKVYTNKDNPSGRDMSIVKKLLDTLLHKTYYLELENIEYKDKNSNTKRVSWRGRISLFMIGEIDNGEMLVQLNSLFALQIRDYYVNYPINFDQLLESSYFKLCGNKRVPTGVYVFLDYLASVRGAKNIYKHEIYKSNLYEKINYRWLKESRKLMLEETINKGIEVAQSVGLLEKYEEVVGATGEKKYVFYTRKNWIKR